MDHKQQRRGRNIVPPKMKLQTIKPEWRQVVDESTGTSLVQWTSDETMNHHFYFTNRTISADGSRGYFVSYRTGYPNLFGIDLITGEITQLSNRVDINPFSPSLSSRSPWIYVSARQCIHAISTQGDEDRELCRFKTAKLGNCSLNSDGSLLAVALRHDDHCELAIVDTQTGTSEIAARAKEIGHIQFCPIDSDLLIYSGTVSQRIWLHDRRTGKQSWVYPQKPTEWIVHESWLGQSREILFPHWPKALRSIQADGSQSRTVTSVNAWHACSNPQGTLIVCDTNHPDRGLLLIDPHTGGYRVLCYPRATQRGTQWQHDLPAVGAGIDTSIIRSNSPELDPPPHPDDSASVYGPQWTHPHPTFSADGRTVIYTSDRDRWSHVYQASLRDT